MASSSYLTVSELRALLAGAGLKVSGTRDSLLERASGLLTPEQQAAKRGRPRGGGSSKKTPIPPKRRVVSASVSEASQDGRVWLSAKAMTVDEVREAINVTTGENALQARATKHSLLEMASKDARFVIVDNAATSATPGGVKRSAKDDQEPRRTMTVKMALLAALTDKGSRGKAPRKGGFVDRFVERVDGYVRAVSKMARRGSLLMLLHVTRLSEAEASEADMPDLAAWKDTEWKRLLSVGSPYGGASQRFADAKLQETYDLYKDALEEHAQLASMDGALPGFDQVLAIPLLDFVHVTRRRSGSHAHWPAQTE
jgi:hypothetical protein